MKSRVTDSSLPPPNASPSLTLLLYMFSSSNWSFNFV